MSGRSGREARAKVVIGGAGFIGSNLADALLRDGEEVIVFDNLSREGTQSNLAWLMANHPRHLHPVVADLRNEAAVAEVVAGADAVFHLAAQVAVTKSIDDPNDDFSVNARGTLAVLEALRRRGRATPLIFASTNKVYGSMHDLELAELDERYVPVDEHIRRNGIDETRPLSFCTPYGCSKGAADQYVLDYARTFGLPTAVLRMSCIYGPRQFGTEDQGWVAHFLVRALAGLPITLYGTGKQVRDVLHVADAVAAYRSVLAHIDSLCGRAFNLGGGPYNAVSLLMVLDEIRRLVGREVVVEQKDWRAGDQLYFAADTSCLRKALGWRPRVQWRAGLADVAAWLAAQASSHSPLLPARRMTA
jgi:CDP-paratose 2-epimerase